MIKPPKQEEKIEEKLGISFANKDLLHKALVHRSYLNEEKGEEESNERLEFLGDAVLEFVVSEKLYTKFAKEDEGHLTALRSKLVNTTSLFETAKKIGLGDALYLSRGEEQTGGRQNSSLLANTLEAIIGAIFIDQGIEKAKDFIERVIISKLPETVKKPLKDAKSEFQEFVQANGYPAPVYKVVSESGPDHAKKFVVEVQVSGKPYAKGKGPNKKIATQKAAEEALALWTRQKLP